MPTLIPVPNEKKDLHINFDDLHEFLAKLKLLFATKGEIATLGFKYKFAQTLPAVASAEKNTIYLIPKSVADPVSGSVTNSYDEYLFVHENSSFELVGNTAGTFEGDFMKRITKEELMTEFNSVFNNEN